MGDNPQESLENTLNTMSTLLGEHQIAPWIPEHFSPIWMTHGSWH